MAEMNTIAYVYGANKGCYMVFERFTCKRPETAARYMKELFKNSLYMACTKGAEEIHIFRTPDHVKPSGEPLIIKLQEV